MKKNMGNADKIIRLALAALVAILYLSEQISGITAIILGAIAVVFFATSIISFCPLYTFLGISTRKKSASK